MSTRSKMLCNPFKGEENTQMRNVVQNIHAQDHGIAVHRHLQVAQTAKRNPRRKGSPMALLLRFCQLALA